jgi:hypothetical protein
MPTRCVNVRRGDFVANKFGSYGGIISEGAKILKGKRMTPDILFFPTIDCAERTRFFRLPSLYHTTMPGKNLDYLQLMAACKHYIIPNSSFAWWAVWFNQHTERGSLSENLVQ